MTHGAATVSSTALLRLLTRFAGQQVLVLGDAMLDRYWRGMCSRISPEAPVPVIRKDESSFAPGGAGNVAANIVAMGGRASLIAIVGIDDAGRDLRHALKKHAVDDHGLITSKTRSTTVKTRIVANQQHVVRIDEEDTSPLAPAEEREVLKRTLQQLARVKVLVLSDYAKGVLSSRVLRVVIEAASKHHIPVLVDPKGSEYTRYNGATLIAPNLNEAAVACGVEDDRISADETGRELLDRLEVKAVLVTQGARGMTIFERGAAALKMPTRARAVFDVTGAGDTVMGALALGFASNGPLECAGQLANLAGGVAVEHLSTSVVTAAQLRRAIRRNGDWQASA